MSSAITLSPYQVLKGDKWPVLSQATPISDAVFEMVSAGALGSVLTQNIGYFEIGRFYIDVKFLKPHPSQRPILSSHAENLKGDFERNGIDRADHEGVVIGIGKGWEWMKHNDPIPFRITEAFTHLDKLRSTDSCDGFIGHIIRGGHRTEAIRRYAEIPGNEDEGYWLYKVLCPGKSLLI